MNWYKGSSDFSQEGSGVKLYFEAIDALPATAVASISD